MLNKRAVGQLLPDRWHVKALQKVAPYFSRAGRYFFPYSEKARHLTTAIRAGGAISAGTAGVVTLAMRKAFIKVCQMVKLGKLSEAEITSSKGAAVMKTEFKKQIQKKKD